MDVSSVVLLLLLSVAGCSAKKGAMRAAGSQTTTLQPWFVGLSAVTGFLCIVFIILVGRRLLRKNRDSDDVSDYDKPMELEGVESKQTSF